MPPSQLLVSTTGSLDNPTTYSEAIVGEEVQYTVFGKDVNLHHGLRIDLQQSAGNDLPTVELPNQEWMGETVCLATQQPVASVGSPCPDGWWIRQFKYTARNIEINTEYRIYLQAEEQFWGTGLLQGARPLFNRQALAGSGCCQPAGGSALCTMDNFRCAAFPRAIRHDAVHYLNVTVRQLVPTFLASVPLGRLLFAINPRTQNLQSTGGSNQPGTPADDAALPTAYVNCPMPPFGVYATKSNAVDLLTIDIHFGGEGYADPSEHGLTYTTDKFYFRRTVTDSQDFNDYALYMGVSWTPPPGAEGRTYRICFRAYDDVSSTTSCSTVHVARCMYCTKEGESLVSIAQRFRTDWLQVWAANDADVVASNTAELAASQVRPWGGADVRHPHDLEEGVLIRLGPLLHTRLEHSLDEIAGRYGTTVRSLLEVNPDLLGLDGPVPRNSELCVLPAICNPNEEFAG